MTTLYYCSRGYYQLRAALIAALRSPFLQAAAIAILALAALDRIDHARGDISTASAAVMTAPSANGAVDADPDDRLLAWSILAARGANGAAERSALEHLFHLGEPLDGLSFNDPTLNLSGLDLSIRDGRAASLRGVGFAGVDLSGARLQGADLYRANFAGAALGGADLTRANLGAASLTGADLSTALLQRASLARARLDGVSAMSADLSDAALARVSAVGARFDGVIALNSDWRGADLSTATLRGADLTGARVDHAHFDGAELSGASFFGTTGVETASFTGAWAWADSPPIGLPDTVRITLCDPAAAAAPERALGGREQVSYQVERRVTNIGAVRPANC